MKYLKQWKDTGEVVEVTHEDALRTVLGCYEDNAEVRELLTIENQIIPCMFSIIKVVAD